MQNRLVELFYYSHMHKLKIYYPFVGFCVNGERFFVMGAKSPSKQYIPAVVFVDRDNTKKLIFDLDMYSIAGFAVTSDFILILSYNLRVYKYDLDGKRISKRKLGFETKDIWAHDNHLFIANEHNVSVLTLRLERLDALVVPANVIDLAFLRETIYVLTQDRVYIGSMKGGIVSSFPIPVRKSHYADRILSTNIEVSPSGEILIIYHDSDLTELWLYEEGGKEIRFAFMEDSTIVRYIGEELWALKLCKSTLKCLNSWWK